MAALPPSNTERWWLVYTVNGFTHRMMMRTADGDTPAGVSSAFDALLVKMAPMLYDLVPNELEFSLKGSNIRNTAMWLGAANYGTGTAISNDGRVAEYSFVGRSPGGKRIRLFLFGSKISANGDYRIQTAESAAVADSVNILNAATTRFLAIDSQHPNWKGYVNTGLNDYWVRQARHG